ncbi:polysaccharide export protein [Chloroherpeton thalassium ATCC 35110]|uniref:Polysaccharide export protein n=1 Tax=Chloroherpeton thalassium (strain ATCC 35110 / GB-78) TaxID=517418 RepID=B3QV12_CHLT3|nr:SLBB domain-containing protein [Chloroherpeton thalassium]ACF14513.1 polysaccharide export protein [Chloroherpeton thalassium ATCC 35110]
MWTLDFVLMKFLPQVACENVSIKMTTQNIRIFLSKPLIVFFWLSLTLSSAYAQVSSDQILNLMGADKDLLNQVSSANAASDKDDNSNNNSAARAPQSRLLPRENSKVEQILQPRNVKTRNEKANPIMVGANYVLQIGDKINLAVFDFADTSTVKRKVAEYELAITRDGMLALPGIGVINVIGLDLRELRQVIQYKLLEKSQTAESIVTLQQIQQRLVQFGYDLFDNISFNVNQSYVDIPVPASYVLGPGDVIKIQLYGNKNTTYSLKVSRSGMISIPEIGPISIAGQSFQNVEEKLEKLIASQMIGVQSDITMGKLRSINIYVLGNAMKPGAYMVNSLTTMFDALFVCGGIKPIGTLRNVQLKRNGNTIVTMDIYSFLMNGDNKKDIRLLPGDVIFIPAIGRTAGISGEVKRPAIYELTKNETVQNLINYAGGFLPTAFPGKAQVEKINVVGERFIQEIDLKQDSVLDHHVVDGDVYYVPSVLDKVDDMVTLDGHVYRPGVYQWKDGMRLTDLIPSYDVLLAKPEMDYVLIRRELPPNREVKVISTSLKKAFENQFSVENVSLKPKDKVIIFGEDEARDEKLNPILDELRAQSASGKPVLVVQASGLVKHPGEYPLEDDMRISDLLRASGSLKEEAFSMSAELTRYDVVGNEFREIQHFPVDLQAVLKGDKKTDILLKSHDILHFKKIPLWEENSYVEVSGEVSFPGRYPIKRGETMKSLLKRVGGLTEFASPDAAFFIRNDLKMREQDQLDKMVKRMESDLAMFSLEQMQNNRESMQGYLAAKALLDQLKATKAIGRLVIDFPMILDNMASKENDILLRDGDKLIIPKKIQEVTVIGEVFNQTSFMYDGDLSRDDYIERTGGMTNNADGGAIYTIRADGIVTTDDNILPGDVIVVPLDVTRIDFLSQLSRISEILYHLAVTTASLKTIGVF